MRRAHDEGFDNEQLTHEGVDMSPYEDGDGGPEREREVDGDVELMDLDESIKPQEETMP